MEEKRKSKGGRIPKDNKRTHCVMVRFDDVEWARFLTLYEQSGVYAKAVFVKSRVFGESFRVIKIARRMWTSVKNCHRFMLSSGVWLSTTIRWLKNCAATSLRRRRWPCSIVWNQ